MSQKFLFYFIKPITCDGTTPAQEKARAARKNYRKCGKGSCCRGPETGWTPEETGLKRRHKRERRWLCWRHKNAARDKQRCIRLINHHSTFVAKSQQTILAHGEAFV